MSAVTVIAWLVIAVIAFWNLRINIHNGRADAWHKRKLSPIRDRITKIMAQAILVFFLSLLLTAGQQHERTFFQRNIYLFFGLSFVFIVIVCGEIPYRLSYRHYKKKFERGELL